MTLSAEKEIKVLEVREREGLGRERSALEKEAREALPKEGIFVLRLERSESKPLDFICREHFGQREQPAQRP